ncbi:MAG: EF-hand domain-containing protein [Deltaproteobacteria bacterium]|nr:EF-hand domain-containing protein [Deltaproteobacteria bacterium]MBF0523688.1 EF-hand domain-containing protein [Deltaproteobacteria bacterium]
MKHFVAIMVVLVVFCVLGCSPTSEQRQEQGQAAPDGTGTRPGCLERFNALDTNHNGKLSLDEFKMFHRWGDAETIFKGMDTNGDGVLTPEEFCAKERMGQRR